MVSLHHIILMFESHFFKSELKHLVIIWLARDWLMVKIFFFIRFKYNLQIFNVIIIKNRFGIICERRIMHNFKDTETIFKMYIEL